MPHSAPSWILSKSSLHDGATEWYHYHQEPAIRPADHPTTSMLEGLYLFAVSPPLFEHLARYPQMECGVPHLCLYNILEYYLKTCLWLLPLTVTAQPSPNRNCYQLSHPEIEFAIVEKCMRHCSCTRVQKRRHFKAKTTKPL